MNLATRSSPKRSEELKKIAEMIDQFEVSLPNIIKIVSKTNRESYDPYLKEVLSDLKDAIQLQKKFMTSTKASDDMEKRINKASADADKKVKEAEENAKKNVKDAELKLDEAR